MASNNLGNLALLIAKRSRSNQNMWQIEYDYNVDKFNMTLLGSSLASVAGL